MADKDYVELVAKLAALEERMNTKQAEYKTDIALLAKQAAERERRALTVTISVVAAATAIIIAVVGLLTQL